MSEQPKQHEMTTKKSLQVRAITPPPADIARLVELEIGERASLLIPIKPQPTFIESSGRWCWPLPKQARFPGCCTEVCTASREWWEYAPIESFPYRTGTRLWCKEWFGWSAFASMRLSEHHKQFLIYEGALNVEGNEWYPPEGMPQWAARIHLTTIECKVEQVDGVWQWCAVVERVEGGGDG